MKYEFFALNIPVLRFSDRPDETGIIIPPNVEIEFPKVISVTYGKDDEEMKAGHATLRKEEFELIADFTLFSIMKDPKRCLKMMQKLIPAVGFSVNGYTENIVLKMVIEELFLTPYPNDDMTIKTLGDKLQPKLKPSEMH